MLSGLGRRSRTLAKTRTRPRWLNILIMMGYDDMVIQMGPTVTFTRSPILILTHAVWLSSDFKKSNYYERYRNSRIWLSH